MIAVLRYWKGCSSIVDKVPDFGLEFWPYLLLAFFHLKSFKSKIIL